MAPNIMGPSIRLGTIPNIQSCPGGVCFFTEKAYPVATCPECGREYCTIKCPIESKPTDDPCRLARSVPDFGIACARCSEG